MQLHPEHGDDLKMTQHEPHPNLPGRFMIAHQENGDCVYLDRDAGCKIHYDAPYKCRTMDCRLIPLSIPANRLPDFINRKLITEELWKKGRQMMRDHPRQS